MHRTWLSGLAELESGGVQLPNAHGYRNVFLATGSGRRPELVAAVILKHPFWFDRYGILVI